MANPQKGHLIEVAWGTTASPSPKNLLALKETSFLIEIPDEIEVPRHVTRVTGITRESLCNGIPVKKAWENLIKAADVVKRAGSQPFCPLIIHYAQFEKAYLNYMHQAFGPATAFPFEIICTHQISKRLWPDLPRRGLRAMAGFLGYSVRESRRAADHVAATRWIWHKLVEILDEKEGVKTTEDLKNWLSEISPPSMRKNIKYPMGKEKRKDLPDQPGLYRMLRSNGDLLYVGKATSLRQRVNSYFQKSTGHAEHILEMLSQAVDLSITPTHTVLEAALLESDEIKLQSPPYNIALRKGERKVCFFNEQLNQFSDSYSKSFSMGPFTAVDLLQAISLIMKLISEKEDNLLAVDEQMAKILVVPSDLVPPGECFIEGLHVFFDEYRNVLGPRTDIYQVIQLGAVLWEEMLAQEVEDNENENDDAMDEDKEPEKWEWTPERVARRLKGVIRQGVHMIRRTEWFRRLSESSLLWDKKEAGNSTKNLLILKKACIESCLDLPEGALMPIPPGHKTSPGMRWKHFNIADYDRLRILTTEVKRLLKEKRNPVLCFGPNQMLEGGRLNDELIWV